MTQQSNLERIGIDERALELSRSTTGYDESTPYNASHPNAIADGDEKGKGTGVSMGHLSIPTTKGTHATSTVMGRTTDTTNGGGKYDIDGTKGVTGAFQGDAGRNYLLGGGINPYNKLNEYGPNAIDTSKAIPGQYWVK